MQGIIYKATGGFYYVRTPEHNSLVCRARGLLRLDGDKPCVGDRVQVQYNEDGTGTVLEILPRKNHLVRPPLANLDYMLLILSVTDPEPSFQIVDAFLAILEHKEIEPMLVITKTDLQDANWLVQLYKNVGYTVFEVNCLKREGIQPVLDALSNTFCALSGNSGVGKSSLLNALEPSLNIPVGETSKKLGRGRHTTRHTEVYALENGALIADTPGFSTVEITRMSSIDRTELDACFRDFLPYLGKCRFMDCSHTHEAGCAVLDAVYNKQIAASRHESYRQIYDSIKDIKEWERR